MGKRQDRFFIKDTRWQMGTCRHPTALAFGGTQDKTATGNSGPPSPAPVKIGIKIKPQQRGGDTARSLGCWGEGETDLTKDSFGSLPKTALLGLHPRETKRGYSTLEMQEFPEASFLITANRN